MTEPDKNSSSIALISMPWALYNRPSIQLGCLSAFLKENSDLTVHCFHPYLDLASELGPDRYHLISLASWAGEAIFSPLLFTGKDYAAEKVYSSVMGKKHEKSFVDIKDITRSTIESWLSSIDFSQYAVIGFSVCFDQLIPSLFAAKWIKKHYPDTHITMGGSTCSGDLGKSLLDTFAFINSVISGEGENALLTLCRYIEGTTKQLPAQIFIRETTEKDRIQSKQLEVEKLPFPDFDEYFSQLKVTFPNMPFHPILPLEFSRGCWWGKCSFCNLNIQWHGYRWKKAEQIANEITQHSNRYGILDFAFTDNALPPAESTRFFEAVANQHKDYRFFAEIRSVTHRETLDLFKRGGLIAVQVGIEALSDTLLTKMVKGTTLLDNIILMKECTALGIQLDGNLIIEFPGSTSNEIEETLNILDYILPFRPLSSATFFLGHGSPIHNATEKHGIKPVLHCYNKKLFPKNIASNLKFIAKSYHGNKGIQKELWKPVRKKIAAWNDFHNNRKFQARFALSYRDGGNFITIRQETDNSEVLRHKLNGLSREIYLFCQSIATIDDILNKYPSLMKDNLESFLKNLQEKKLLIRVGDRVLSLALHQPNSQLSMD